MAISFVGQDSALILDVTEAGTGADVTISLPGGTVENDLVVAIAASDAEIGGASFGGGITTAGYTNLMFDNTANNPGHQLAYKKMGATPDSTIDFQRHSGTSVDYAGGFQSFRGVDTTTPIDNSISTASNTTGMPDAPSHTTLTANAWRVAVGMLDDDDVASSVTVPSTYSNLLADDATGGTVAISATFMICSKLEATAGAADPAVFGGSGTDTWYSGHFALRPAAGAGGLSIPVAMASYRQSHQSVV